MRGPYRESCGAEVFEAPSRDGLVRLRLAPRHAALEIGARWHLSVTDRWLTVVDHARRVPRPRSLPLDDHRLVASRAIPTEELALWYEERPGIVQRIAGVRPVELMDQDALRGWHRLEQLGERLRAAVAPAAGGVARAYELGRGGHRVLLMDFDDRLVLFVRPLFRERPRQTLEVRADGRVLIRARDHDQEISCNSRFAVTVLGDRIRFESANRREIANLWLPWVTPEDRRELARRIGLQVDRAGARRRRPLLLRPIFA